MHMLGMRNDVARCMEVMDVFVFPSLYEGLPLSTVEAQAANLPCIISTDVTKMLVTCPELVTRLPLSEGKKVWSSCILSRKSQLSKEEVLTRIKSGPFSINSCMEQLITIYSSTANE